jgi:hypothetical protein
VRTQQARRPADCSRGGARRVERLCCAPGDHTESKLDSGA